MSCKPDYNKGKFHDCTKLQNLYKGLFEEMIQRYGVECKFLPANTDATADEIFGEHRKTIFDNAITIRLFFETYDKYEGEGDIFDKFGIHFEDELILWIDVNTLSTLGKTIQEGDLIYVPMVDALFEVSFAEHEEPFYLLGVQMAYKLKLKKYRKSQEDKFDESAIGDDDIADIIAEESGTPSINEDFQNEADDIKDTDSDENKSIFGDW